MKFRKANETDLSGITEMVGRIIARPGTAWDDEYPLREHFEQTLGHDTLYVAEDGGRIVATCGIHPAEDIFADLECWTPAKNPCEGVRLGIDPDYQGKHLSIPFQVYCINDASRRFGFDWFRFTAAKENKRANDVYRRFGYRLAGETNWIDTDWWCYESQLPLPLKIQYERTPSVCAHRGLSAKYPENSLESFRAAFRAGADEIELDVRLTSDGKLIVSHDNKLCRIADAPEGQTVSNSTFDYLRTLNIGAKTGQNARFCTPDEVFDEFGGRIILNLHLKEAGPDGKIIRELAGGIRARGIGESVYFAGSPAVLGDMKKYEPDIPRTAIQLPWDDIGIVDMAKTYECARVQLWSGLYTKETVDELHSLGIRVNLYHAETPEEYSSALSEGIDTILTNNADTAMTVI